jgi:hypothetical protein
MKKLIERIIPKFVKKKMISYGSRELRRTRYEEDDKVSRFELDEIHFKNLKPLKTRISLIMSLPKGGVIAEVGVNKGEFSSEIHRICKPTKMILVDKWNSTEYPKSLKDDVITRFRADIKSGKIEVIQDDSVTATRKFEDAYFDWIYLDTDHSYEATLQELIAYKDKIKPNGIIAGHDFIIGNWKEMLRYGVKEAVYEFCVTYDWEIIYLTMENREHPSFAIRRIRS